MPHSSRRLPIVRIGAAVAMIALGSVHAFAQEDKVLANVNGKPVTEAELQLAMADLGQQFAQLPEEQRRAAALSALIEIRLLSEEAEKKGLADETEFKQRMELLRQRALHSAFIEKDIASQVTDEAVRARYDQEIAAVEPENEIHARHILVKTKEEADAVIKQLDEGGDFEAIAKEKSTDGAAAQGGDLGYFGSGQMVPDFEKAAFALEVGAHSKEPVQTQFGWHVIKVEDKRPKTPPSFEQVSPQLRSLLLREKYFETVKTMRDGAEVEITDPALKTAVEQIDNAEGAAEGEEPQAE
ncbi:peptidylprolyl isomerase [Aquamicrobium sp. LC103]|uniref:peptidylprolyl isomerase n=1 Tax=Aquamicrobium sp. LC103 TaxID=1120658 RepID=UPI00063E8E98|nr:peptidylprolyl isomerase [Aquamicrobium sp. LC103]TKT75235.1 peptidylprolyl isomerase [Aquamicrobium sp. LC103]